MNTLRFIAGLLAAVGMVFLIYSGVTAAEPTVAPKTTVTTKGFDVSNYVAKGYSANGPIQVLSVDLKKQTLTLYSQPKNVTMNLQGRSVSVTNLTKSRLSLADLTKGMSVYVLQKGKNVLIVALPKKEVRNDQ